MDIHCRICGEPYSCVGGLHFTHTDMPWWEFDQFIRGKGCPSCYGTKRNDEATARPILDDKWMSSLINATDEVEPYPGWTLIAEQPPEFGVWKDREPTVKERLTPTRQQLLADIAQDWEDRLEETEVEVATNLYERRWWFKVSQGIVSACHHHAQLLQRANLKGFEKLADEPGAEWEGCEWDTDGGFVRILVGRQVSNSDKLQLDLAGVALATIVEQRGERGDDQIFDEEIYDKMVDEAYKESIEEEQEKLVDQAMSIFGCSKDVASFVLGRVENLFRQEWENGEPVAYRDEKLSQDLDVLIKLAADLGLPGWTIAQSLGIYGGSSYALIPTYDPGHFEGSHFVASEVVDKDGKVTEEVAPKLRKAEYCVQSYGLDCFNDVKLSAVPRPAARVLMEFLKGER